MIWRSPRLLTNDARFAMLARIAREVMPSYRLSWWQLDWWTNQGFTDYLQRFGELDAFDTHRRFALQQLTRLVAEVPGDTAECGVYRGSSSWVICDVLRGQNRLHHGFDSFQGLSEPENIDGHHWKLGNLAAGIERARAGLQEFGDSVRLYQGWIPDRFNEIADRRFALVHIDVDLAKPTRDSMAFFYPRLNPGGLLIVDDYGCSTCPGATAAVNDYMVTSSNGEPFIALAQGGGFLIRRPDKG